MNLFWVLLVGNCSAKATDDSIKSAVSKALVKP